MTSNCTKHGKRKRSVSEVEDIENCRGPSRKSDRIEHQKKRSRESQHSPPPTPLHPLSPNNQSLVCDTSPKQRRSLGSSSSASATNPNLPPIMTWLNKSGMVGLLSKKDMEHEILPDYFDSHPNLIPRMRSVLLDWLMEVCEAYKLHRQTYYLAVNYLDRYLTRTKGIAKTLLQLIGITCLFIASKVEEIYPPKLFEFAYVTNEACTTEGILAQELLLLDKLDWNMGAVTVNSWLSLLLQICHNRDAQPKSIIFPNHPVKDYLLSAELIDLCMLDENCLRFSYLILASAGIYTMTDYKDVVHNPPLLLSDNQKELLLECVLWMAPFAEIVREKSSPKKSSQTEYTIQSHHGHLALMLVDVALDLECLHPCVDLVMADPFFLSNPLLTEQGPVFSGLDLDGLSKWLNLPTGNRYTISLGRTFAKKPISGKINHDKRLSWAKRRALGLTKLGRNELKYQQLLPVHELWQGYMRHLLNVEELRNTRWNNSPSHPKFEDVSAKMYRADLHGAMISVIQSKCPSYVGLTGIIAMETKNVYKILCKDDKLRTVLKKLCQFELKLDNLKFTFYGHNFIVRPADRSSKKIKLIRPPTL